MDPVIFSSIRHDGSSRYVRPAKGVDLHIGDEVTIRLRTTAEAPIERLLRRTSPALIEGGFQVLAAEKDLLAVSA